MTFSQKKQLHTFAIPQVKPEGWLLQQLKIQMNGLTGKLYQIWDSVGSYSGWLGGTGENWERAPYYLDGLLPLAYYLKDKERWELACRFIKWSINSQDPEGNFGPQSSKADYWSRFVMLKVLKQYYEITKDERVLYLFDNYFHYLLNKLPKAPMTQWSRARIGDLLYCMIWYDEVNPKNTCIKQLADLLREQSLDWADIFENFPFTRPAAYYYNWKLHSSHFHENLLDESMNFHTTHIVNVTMGFKYPAMLSYFYEDRDYKKITLKGIESAEKYHGVASGAINGDEHLSGNNPSQGAELCSIVEYMFSLQGILEAFGSPLFADRLERLAYNALPATITEDFMGHQYLQQANQVLSTKAKRNWFNNNEESNLFGLEPNFGCCTANMHQGWPKLVQSLWFQEDENTLVSMVHAPSTLTASIQGQDIQIQAKTEYPFKNRILYHIRGDGAKLCTLKIRVPGWCKQFRLLKNGISLGDEATCNFQEGFLTLEHLRDNDCIEFYPEMNLRISKWFHNSLAVERGALVYGLQLKEKWMVQKEVSGVKDYAVYPESSWNYAIPETPSLTVEELSVSKTPFSGTHPPVRLKGKGRLLKSWKLENNSAGTLPVSPVTTDMCEEELTFIPYGCTKLRITQFPYYENKQ